MITHDLIGADSCLLLTSTERSGIVEGNGRIVNHVEYIILILIIEIQINLYLVDEITCAVLLRPMWLFTLRDIHNDCRRTTIIRSRECVIHR